MAEFDGFARPTSNYYRLPNNWFDLWRQTRQVLATGERPARIIAPLKVTEYIIKYTWGYSNFETAVRLSRSDLRQAGAGGEASGWMPARVWPVKPPCRAGSS